MAEKEKKAPAKRAKSGAAQRGPDGRFLPGETFEFKCPGEENGEPVIDAFARWAAERYRREQEQKEEKRNG